MRILGVNMIMVVMMVMPVVMRVVMGVIMAVIMMVMVMMPHRLQPAHARAEPLAQRTILNVRARGRRTLTFNMVVMTFL